MDHPHDDDVIRRLERLRSRRTRPAAGAALSDDLQETSRRLARSQKKTSGLTAAWERVCPPELLERTSIEGFGRGVLRIRVPDAATRFALDRALRGGVERALITSSPAGIRRVKVSVGPIG